MEMVGAGFGRTGTMPLKVALEELGFGPYYMIELFENAEFREATMWRGPVDFRARDGCLKSTCNIHKAFF